MKKKITHYHNDHYELIKSKIDHQREIFVESITVHPQFTQTHTCAHACGSWFKMWLVFCAQPNEREETVGSNKKAPYMQRLTEHFVQSDPMIFVTSFGAQNEMISFSKQPVDKRINIRVRARAHTCHHLPRYFAWLSIHIFFSCLIIN